MSDKNNKKDDIINKVKTLRISVVVLAALVVIVSIILVVSLNKNKSVSVISNSIENSYSDIQNELSSAIADNSTKSDELNSYSQAVDEQNSVYASEKESLKNKINELNKQISIKKASQTTSSPAVPVPDNPPVPEVPVDGSAKTVYLTFDDGPSPRTPDILRILNEQGVKATFFVKNTKYNNYMNDIVNSGNQIALHTYSHEYSDVYSSDETYYNDLQKISDVVFNQTGIRSNLVRFPGGSSNTVSKKYCSGIMSRVTAGIIERGYSYYDWNVSSGDANVNQLPSTVIISNCRKLPKSNTVIVLMHDTNAKGTTVEALPEIISYYKSIGCSFGIIDSSTPQIHQHINN